MPVINKSELESTSPDPKLTAIAMKMVLEDITAVADRWPQVTVEIVHWFSGYVYRIDAVKSENLVKVYIGANINYNPAQVMKAWPKHRADFILQLRTACERVATAGDTAGAARRKTEIDRAVAVMSKKIGMPVVIKWKPNEATIFKIRFVPSKGATPARIELTLQTKFCESATYYEECWLGAKELEVEAGLNQMMRQLRTGGWIK